MKKTIYGLLAFLITSVVIGAGVIQKMNTDKIQFGISTSTDEKEIIVDVGDGATNPRIKVDSTDKDFSFNKNVRVEGNRIIIGDGTNTDKFFEWDIGLGANNPYFSWDSASNALSFTNDAVSVKKIGSGSGAGGGINFLSEENFDFEAGSPPQSWTASGLFTAETTDNLFGEQSGFFDAGLLGQELSSPLVALSEFKGADGQSCQAEIIYKANAIASGDYSLNVINQAAVIVATAAINPTTGTKTSKSFIVFDCPDSTQSLRLAIKSEIADPSPIVLDNAFLGTGKNTVSVAQNAYYGGVKWGVNCGWANASPSIVIPSDTDCTGTTINGNITIPDENQPVLNLTKLKPNTRYTVKMNALFVGQSQAEKCAYVLYKDSVTAPNVIGHLDIADMFGITIQSKTSSYLFGEFTTGPSQTSETVILGIRREATGGANSCVISQRVDLLPTLDIYEYPSQPSEAVTLETSGFYIDARIQNGFGQNPALGTSVNTYSSPSSSSFQIIKTNGSADVQISCETAPSTGTTCASGNEELGVTVDLDKGGAYRACFDFTHFTAVSSGATIVNNFKLATVNEGTDTIIEEANYVNSSHRESATGNASGGRHIKLCGIFELSAGRHTLEVLSRVTSSTGSILANIILAEGDATGVPSPTIDRTARFSMIRISEQFPQPVFTELKSSLNEKMGTSNQTGDVVAAATINCDSTPQIVLDYDSFISSVSYLSSGLCQVNFTTTFTGQPICTVSPTTATGASSVRMATRSASGTAVQLINPAGGTNVGDFDIICRGEK